MEQENKRRKHLRVPVFTYEEITIKDNADSVGLSVASYLRELGLGYQPTSNLDAKLVMQLAAINADQSRLGNLLKLALSNPEKLDLYGDKGVVEAVAELTKQIKDFQKQLLDVNTRK